MTSKKTLGQYFTVDVALQKFVFDKTVHKGQRLLEPSFGAGHLLRHFLLLDPNYPMSCYEIDNTITPCVTFGAGQEVCYGDFMGSVINTKFKTIIGNPPYVKKPQNRNLYLQFIEKSVDLLADDGELLFIVPSDFLKLTSAAEILRKMVDSGSFTDFLFPNNEKLFEESTVDVVVFRYQKGLKTDICTYNGVAKRWLFSSGMITFRGVDSVVMTDLTPIGELFDCYVGFVSGKDNLFINPLGNMNILYDKDKVKNCICINNFPTGNQELDTYLNLHKNALLERKIRTFNDTNWFTWGAIRNRAIVEEKLGQDCIYVRTMTRKAEIAFVGKVQYFGGGLLCMIPKVEGVNLQAIINLLNSADVKQNYMYSGRFKIGQRQLSLLKIAYASS